MRSNTLLHASLLLCSCSALVRAEALMEFVDLRAQGGVVAGRYGGSLTLMAGNIGNKDQTLEMPDDSGIVVGVRATTARLRAKDDEDDVDLNMATIGLVIGLGYCIDKTQHLELNGGWSAGRPTLLTEHGGYHNDGYGTVWNAELGWYTTWQKHIQIGLVGGWSWSRFNVVVDEDTTVPVRAGGLEASLVLGYRF
jgi:hypothetical protein